LAALFLGQISQKNADLYLFLGLYHVAALHLCIWDASQDKIFVSYPLVALGAADSPGMTYLNGLVGHLGKHGCQLYCSITGQHKEGGSHYYPALLKPLNYTVSESSHNDIPLTNLPSCSLSLYHENLQYLLESDNESQYKKHCLQTGISKPSIFIGLQQEKILSVPGCGSDIMHLAALNIPDLLINLW